MPSPGVGLHAAGKAQPGAIPCEFNALTARLAEGLGIAAVSLSRGTRRSHGGERGATDRMQTSAELDDLLGYTDREARDRVDSTERPGE